MLTPDERADAIKKAVQEHDIDEVVNERLKEIYVNNRILIDRISPQKSAIFALIAQDHFRRNIEFNNLFHMYVTILSLGFSLGHDYVVAHGAMEQEIDEEGISGLLTFLDEPEEEEE